MTTFFDGLEVPETLIEYFSGKTLDAFGEVVLTLRYTPKEGTVGVIIQNQFLRLVKIDSVVGKDVSLYCYYPSYYRVDSPTMTTNAAGGGTVAEPHSHAIGDTRISCGNSYVAMEAGYNFAVSYMPEGGS